MKKLEIEMNLIEIDFENPAVRAELSRDIIKLNKIRPRNIPEEADTLVFHVKHSNIKPPEGRYLFNIELQYAVKDLNGDPIPIGQRFTLDQCYK